MTPREEILLGVIKTQHKIAEALVGVIERNCPSINDTDAFVIRACANMMNISAEEIQEFIDQDNLVSELKESLTFVN